MNKPFGELVAVIKASPLTPREKWRTMCKLTAAHLKTKRYVHVSTYGATFGLTEAARQAKLDRTSSRRRRLAREGAGLAEGGG